MSQDLTLNQNGIEIPTSTLETPSPSPEIPQEPTSTDPKTTPIAPPRTPKHDSYEAQLTPKELEHLHKSILAPDADLNLVQHELPPWRSGPYASSKPSVRTLYSIAKRLRTGQALEELGLNTQVLGKVKAKLKSDRVFAKSSPGQLEDIIKLMGVELTQKILRREDQRNQLVILRLLLKYEQLAMDRSRMEAQLNADEGHANLLS